MKTTQKLKRILCAAVAFLLIAVNATGAAFAVEQKYDYSALSQSAFTFLENKVGGDLSNYLAENEGNSESDWIALCIKASGRENIYSLDAYSASLNEKLDNVTLAMDTLRVSLVLSALGENPEYINNSIVQSSDKLGIMSNIFGLLIAVSSNYNNTDFIDDIVTEILSLQNENGAFGIGNIPDVDVTSMAVYALSFLKDHDNVQTPISKAINYLSSVQQENGGFSSYGVENCESCAQVIIALCSMGINPQTDARFIKSGNNTIENLLSYRNENGSFSHTIGLSENISATRQALEALISCEMFFNGGTFILDFNTPQNIIVPDSSTTLEIPTKNGNFYKFVTILCVTVIFCFVLLINLFSKRLNFKKAIAIIAAAALCITVLSFCKFESREEYYGQDENSNDVIIPKTLTVSCTIDCKQAKDITSFTHYPENGIIYSTGNIEIADGDSVFDLLLKITQAEQIQIDYSESFSSVYIKGIGFLYEFDGGTNSGWSYTVGGESAKVSADNYILKSGDVVVWTYVLDYTQSNIGGTE